MSAKSPLGKIKDVADLAVGAVVSTVSGTVKDPVGTGQKVVGQAIGVAGAVASRVPGLKKPAPERPEPVRKDEPEVAPVVPMKDKATKATPKNAPAKKAPAKKAPVRRPGAERDPED